MTRMWIVQRELERKAHRSTLSSNTLPAIAQFDRQTHPLHDRHVAANIVGADLEACRILDIVTDPANPDLRPDLATTAQTAINPTGLPGQPETPIEVSDDEEDPAGQRHRFHLPARENDDEAVALQAIVAACLGGVPRAPVGAVLANGRTVPPFHPNYFTLDFSLSVTSDAVLISYYFLSLASNKQTKPRYVARQVQL
ncbi:hypothetical protein XPA_008070 [Xanthoria parietina]